jgi:hypothetical protein
MVSVVQSHSPEMERVSAPSSQRPRVSRLVSEETFQRKRSVPGPVKVASSIALDRSVLTAARRASQRRTKIWPWALLAVPAALLTMTE